ncbi:MAG: pectate lyase [Geminicoccaceae bacterium]
MRSNQEFAVSPPRERRNKRRPALSFVTGAMVMLTACAHDVHADGEQDRQDVAAKASASLRHMTQALRSRSLNGGYAGLYPPEATPDELKTIRIQYPGTPDVGQCLLRAHAILGDQDFLDAAGEVGRALAWYQSRTGGWPIEIEEASTPPAADEGMVGIQRRPRNDTLDDNTTQGALGFLLDLDEEIDQPWLDEAIDLGLDFLLKSQLEAGGWPQYYPLIGGYHDFYTFNDGAINNVIDVLLKAHARTGESRYLESALRGADFIIASQLPPPQSGWAQQYDWDLEPAAARAFEPVAVSSSSTSRNILTLIDIVGYTSETRYLEPIPAAITWLETSALDKKSWARFYELETNRPIYPLRSGGIVDSIEKLPEAERGKYAYIAGFKAKEAISLYRKLTENGHANDFKSWHDMTFRTKAKRKAEKSARDVADVIAYGEADRKRPDGDVVSLGKFTAMCDTVLNYLEFPLRS